MEVLFFSFQAVVDLFVDGASALNAAVRDCVYSSLAAATGFEAIPAGGELSQDAREAPLEEDGEVSGGGDQEGGEGGDVQEEGDGGKVEEGGERREGEEDFVQEGGEEGVVQVRGEGRVVQEGGEDREFEEGREVGKRDEELEGEVELFEAGELETEPVSLL